MISQPLYAQIKRFHTILSIRYVCRGSTSNKLKNNFFSYFLTVFVHTKFLKLGQFFEKSLTNIFSLNIKDIQNIWGLVSVVLWGEALFKISDKSDARFPRNFQWKKVLTSALFWPSRANFGPQRNFFFQKNESHLIYYYTM